MQPVDPIHAARLAAKADSLARKADALSRPGAHESGMANAFPLGAGFGHNPRAAARQIDASVSRAVQAVTLRREADQAAALAVAYAAGKVTKQGRRNTPELASRSEKRETQTGKRLAKIEAAKDRVAGQPRHAISPEDWATSQGYLAGGARALLMGEQAEYLANVGTTADAPTTGEG